MGYMKYCSQWTQLARFWALFQLISKAQRGRNSLLGILSLPCNHNNGCIWTVPTGYPNIIKSINEEQSVQNLLMSWWFFTVMGSWTSNRTVLILFQYLLGIKQNLASYSCETMQRPTPVSFHGATLRKYFSKDKESKPNHVIQIK